MLGVNTPALPASLRRTNQRTVISLLQKMGCASRADLAKAAGISQPTAGKIISYLLQLGVLQRVSSPEDSTEDETSRRLGRPGQLVRLDTDRQRFMAVELGVSETCIAPLALASPLQDQWASRFRTPATPDSWLHALKAAAKTTTQLWGVLISVPGIVDESAAKAI